MNVFWNYIAVTMVQRREYPKATELYTDFQMVKLLILSQFKKYLLFSISSLSCWPTKFVASCAEASFLGCQGTWKSFLRGIVSVRLGRYFCSWISFLGSEAHLDSSLRVSELQECPLRLVLIFFFFFGDFRSCFSFYFFLFFFLKNDIWMSFIF